MSLNEAKRRFVAAAASFQIRHGSLMSHKTSVLINLNCADRSTVFFLSIDRILSDFVKSQMQRLTSLQYRFFTEGIEAIEMMTILIIFPRENFHVFSKMHVLLKRLCNVSGWSVARRTNNDASEFCEQNTPLLN